MSIRRYGTYGVQLLIGAAVLAMIVGFALGQPVLLSFVETGSMEPTLDPGDGFVAIPAQVTGEVETGDVVVFEARELDGGGLTTHRVVGETEAGYITQGDANPFPDQDGSEPPVQDAQIVATALELDGEVLVVPGFGTAVMAFQSAIEGTQRQLAVAFDARWLLETGGLATVLFVLSVAAWIVDSYLEESGADRPAEPDRDRDAGTSIRAILLGCVLVVVLAATAGMVAPSDTLEYDLISAEFDSENPTVVQAGTSQSHEYEARNNGLVPVHTYVESDSDRAAVDPGYTYLGSRGGESVTVTLSAPETTGHYPTYVEERRYLAVLPKPVVDPLHAAHPWLPILAINAVLGGGLYVLGRLVIGPTRTRLRSEKTPTKRSLTGRIRRRLYDK